MKWSDIPLRMESITEDSSMRGYLYKQKYKQAKNINIHMLN